MKSEGGNNNRAGRLVLMTQGTHHMHESDFTNAFHLFDSDAVRLLRILCLYEGSNNEIIATIPYL